MEPAAAQRLLDSVAPVKAHFAEVVSAPTQGPFSGLGATIVYREKYVQTIPAVALFGLDKDLFTDQRGDVETAAAVRKLLRFLKSQQLPYIHSALDGAQNERDAFVIITESPRYHFSPMLQTKRTREETCI
jgi:hypothetical protein